MTKKDALKQSAAAVRVEYEAAHEAINTVFDSVRSSFLEADTELEIVARNSWNREITGRITNKVMQWSSEVVRFDLIPLKDEEKFELKFNYGSGGWNDGIDAQRQLMFMSDCLRAVCLAQNIANDSKVTLSVAMDKFFELQETLGSIQSDIRDIENAEKRDAENVEREKVMEALNLPRAKSGASYLKELTDGLVDGYREVKLAYVYIDSDGKVRFNRKELSAEKYKKTVFKIDGSRVSRADLENLELKGYVEVSRDLQYSGALNWFRSMDLESVLNNLKAFNAQEEVA